MDFNLLNQTNQMEASAQPSSRRGGAPVGAGSVRRANLAAQQEGEIRHDAVTLLEENLRQFDQQVWPQIQRYVENLVTGQFLHVRKDVDLTVNRENVKDIATSRYQVEYELLQSQHKWINRINSFFTTTLGLLSGMSVMHLIILAVESESRKFLAMYMPFAMIFNMAFLVLSNLCLIFGITIALIYKEKSEDRQRSLDQYRHKLRLNYTI